MVIPDGFELAGKAMERARAELEVRLPEWKAWAEEHPGRQGARPVVGAAAVQPAMLLTGTNALQ